MSVLISSLATAVPEFKVTQGSTVQLLSSYMNLSSKEEKLLQRIYKSTGIECRHSVISDYETITNRPIFFPQKPTSPYPSTAKRMEIYKANALPLALNAINRCLNKRDGLKLADITHLITVSCTGMYAPGLDIEIVNHLGLKSTTSRTAINFMGCYGAFNGLKVAAAFCKANPNAKVLLVCIELCSLHFQEELTRSNIISNAIFSDGAAAAIIEGESSAKSHIKLEHFHADILPDTGDKMAWAIGNNGFEMVLDSYVPSLIREGIYQFFQALLSQTGVSLDHIDNFAIHPGGLNILKGCEKALSIPIKKIKHSYDVLNKYGNMSSVTFLFVLDEIISNSEKQNKLNILGCAFGPGLTMESLLMEAHVSHENIAQIKASKEKRLHCPA